MGRREPNPCLPFAREGVSDVMPNRVGRGNRYKRWALSRKLGLLIVLFPLLEVISLAMLGRAIGAFQTLVVVIVVGVVGAFLAKTQGLLTLRRIEASLAAGELPGDQLLTGLIVLVAGVLLIIPGFVGDIIGILLLLPPVQAVVRAWLKAKLVVFAGRSGAVFLGRHIGPFGDDRFGDEGFGDSDRWKR